MMPAWAVGVPIRREASSARYEPSTVGTVLRAAEGSLKLSIPEITASRRREYAGHTVPACGLYLNRVFYD